MGSASALPDLQVMPLDQRGAALLAAGGDLNPHTKGIWERLLSLDDWDMVIDVGANYGEMLRTSKLPEDARVIAVEGDRRLLPFLRGNTRHLGDRIHVIDAVVGESAGSAQFLIDREWSGRSRVGERTAAGDPLPAGSSGQVEVAVTTIDALVPPGAGRRACVKIDVEGHERAVIDGARRFLASLDEFVILTEIMLLGPEDLARLAREWIVLAVDARSRRLVRIPPLHHERDASIVDWFVGLARVGLFMDAVVLPPGSPHHSTLKSTGSAA